jgi:transposase
MKELIKDGSEMTIGVDLGDKFSQLCVLDDGGEVCETARIKTTAMAMRHRFEAIGPCRVVIEVGTHSPWVQRLLEGMGHEVITAHTQAVRLIYGGTHKDDRLDAERLARLARVDPKLLHPIRHRTGSTQADRGIVRSRQALLECRTRLINHARGMVKSLGGVFYEDLPQEDPREPSARVEAGVGARAGDHCSIDTEDPALRETHRRAGCQSIP